MGTSANLPPSIGMCEKCGWVIYQNPPHFCPVKIDHIPYKCPICNGSGAVLGGFYLGTGGTSASDKTMEPCRSCNGTGVIWGG